MLFANGYASKLESDPPVMALASRNLGTIRIPNPWLTWRDVQRWDDGSGRIIVIRSKTDVEAAGAMVAITPAAMRSPGRHPPAGVPSSEKVFGLSESQIARRVKVIAKAAGLADWELSAATADGWA